MTKKQPTEVQRQKSTKASVADAARALSERPLILALRVLNFRSITLAEVKFDVKSGIVTIQGPNKSGKTDLLCAVEWALRGKALRSEPEKRGGALAKPKSLVRDGQTVARVEVTIWDQDQYQLVKTVDDQGVEVLRVKDAAGRVSDSTELLKRWISAWSFNAAYLDRAINRGDVREWSPIILSLAHFSLTPAECQQYRVSPQAAADPIKAYQALELEERRLYELRAASNGRIAEAKAIYEGIELEPGTPEEEPDFKAKGEERVGLLAEKGECARRQLEAIRVARELEADRETLNEQAQSKRMAVQRLTGEIAQLDGTIKKIEGALKETRLAGQNAAFKRQAKLDKLEEEFTGFSALIGKWQKRKQQLDAQQMMENERLEQAKRTQALEDCRDFRLRLPGRVVLPIEGLQVRGEEVLLTALAENGTVETRVWTEWNEATRLAFSIKIAAAKLEAGQIGFVVIPSTSLLTAKTFAVLKEYAVALNVVLICEYSSDDLRQLGDQNVWLEVR